MSKFNVRAATRGDMDRILALYAAVIADVSGKPWDVCWEIGRRPSVESLEEAIDAGELIVGELVGEDAAQTPPVRAERSVHAGSFLEGSANMGARLEAEACKGACSEDSVLGDSFSKGFACGAVDGEPHSAGCEPRPAGCDGPANVVVGCDADAQAAPPLACAAVINNQVASGYEQVPWLVDAAPAEVMCLHLFCVNPAFCSRGLGLRFLHELEDIARSRGAKVFRLDVLPNNTPARRLYAKAGFTDHGFFHLFYGEQLLTDFHLLEKAL